MAGETFHCPNCEAEIVLPVSALVGKPPAHVGKELKDDECDACGVPIEDTGCEAYVMDGSKVTEEVVFLCDECWASYCVQFDEPQPFMLPGLEKHDEVAQRALPET